MTSIKVKVRPSQVAGKAGTVYYQVIHRREVRQISTRLHLFPGQWDETQQRILSDAADLRSVESCIRRDTERLHRIIRELENASRNDGSLFSAADIVARFRGPQSSVTAFLRGQIRQLLLCGRIGTARNYASALSALDRFLAGRELAFPELTQDFAERYAGYLWQKGLAGNSVSFHMRILRAVYNKAVREGLVWQSYPFRNVYTGIDRTRKRAVGTDLIARLVRLDLSRSAPLALTRDLFLFSLYTRGMSFVDIAFLTHDNIRDGMVSYVRRKTRQPLCVRIEPCIRQLIDRYAGKGGIYVFPILKSEDPSAAYLQYRVAMAYYNRLLKRLSALVGLKQGLSFYAARHSWATFARDNQVPISIISAGMGHRSERTTQIYLSSIENSVIDNANREILRKLNRVHSS